MRRTTKLSIALIGVSLLIAGEGLLTQDRVEPPSASGTSGEAAGLIDAAGAGPGMKSTDQLIELWSARVAASSVDYLSRTHLGFALLTKARESGDPTIYEDAQAVLEEALQINPRHPAALLGLGSARGAQHDFAAQRTLAEQVLSLQPSSRPALAAVGDASLELGDYVRARDAYQRLATEEQTSPILSRLARLAAIQGRLDEAEALAQDAATKSRAADLAPREIAQYLFQLANIQYERGRVDHAAKTLRTALAGVPDHLPSLELIAKVRVGQGRLDDAIDVYERLIARAPGADLHGALAALYDATGRHDEASRQVDAGLELGRASISRFPAERRHLASFFSRHDAAIALELAQADLETRQDVYGYDTLAWALYQNHRYPEAAIAMERAFGQGTRDVELLYHGGMIAAATGDDSTAAKLLTAALAINPRFDLVEAVRARATLTELPSTPRP